MRCMRTIPMSLTTSVMENRTGARANEDENGTIRGLKSEHRGA